ncbi:hypothetical protein Ga0123462_0839 [Mariprofundus ferrinatatus]|uniref:Uncharacterized protein n=1 Tax=Mariprofundus ferrinatatus TaxID=1921087 RepID=A0A2K8L302_9PROT|nr:hypothetical protein [Mariprofundus ferrinatatus]ATX81708.1 hypothetical protein Ga0123462_0839 [Mariprofundus ferrinatatus]
MIFVIIPGTDTGYLNGNAYTSEICIRSCDHNKIAVFLSQDKETIKHYGRDNVVGFDEYIDSLKKRSPEQFI